MKMIDLFLMSLVVFIIGAEIFTMIFVHANFFFNVIYAMLLFFSFIAGLIHSNLSEGNDKNSVWIIMIFLNLIRWAVIFYCSLYFLIG